jgi:hypothetical protein
MIARGVLLLLLALPARAFLCVADCRQASRLSMAVDGVDRRTLLSSGVAAFAAVAASSAPASALFEDNSPQGAIDSIARYTLRTDKVKKLNQY